MTQPPGGVGPRPTMGIMPPGSISPAMNPAMQPYAGGPPQGVASQQSQQQQQVIVTKMQQCMTNTQKLQQMLNSGMSHKTMHFAPAWYAALNTPVYTLSLVLSRPFPCQLCHAFNDCNILHVRKGCSALLSCMLVQHCGTTAGHSSCACLAGKNQNGQPLTDELRQTYQNQYNAVLAHYKRLQVQYNMLRSGMVGFFVSFHDGKHV